MPSVMDQLDPVQGVLTVDHGFEPNHQNTVSTSLPTPPGAVEYVERQQQSPNKAPLRVPSPSPSCSSLSTLPTPSAETTSNTTKQPPAKRMKLTFAEKESKRLEKEASERRKSEEKAKREAEKEVKDRQRAEERSRKEEEKRQKEIEKEQRRLAKEEKDKEKEEERRKKDKEKAKKKDEEEKKAKSQLRLNSFFAKPTLKNDGHQSPKRSDNDGRTSRRNSVTSIKDETQRSRSNSAAPQQIIAPRSDYQKAFPSFFFQSHTTIAKPCYRSLQQAPFIEHELDQYMSIDAHGIDHDTLSSFRNQDASKRRCKRPNHQVKEIIARLQGTSQTPIDITGSDPTWKRTPLDLLKDVPMKYLKFAEDVRPPYLGTYTRSLSLRRSAKLQRQPFTRGLPHVNYDYDSEAEWEDPGEGEDLDSEGEEEIEEDDDEEMSGFVDDGDADEFSRKRKPMLGDLEPSCTGLCWEDFNGKVDAPIDLRPYTFMTIYQEHCIPIDPYSTEYWQSTPVKPKLDSTDSVKANTTATGTMNPPSRTPLANISPYNVRKTPFSNSDSSKENQPLTTAIDFKQSNAPKGAKKIVSEDVLSEFKVAIVGSDLTKAGLVEVLKKQFPKQSKDAIKDTLGLVAERQGRTESEKRWVLK